MKKSIILVILFLIGEVLGLINYFTYMQTLDSFVQKTEKIKESAKEFCKSVISPYTARITFIDRINSLYLSCLKCRKSNQYCTVCQTYTDVIKKYKNDVYKAWDVLQTYPKVKKYLEETIQTEKAQLSMHMKECTSPFENTINSYISIVQTLKSKVKLIFPFSVNSYLIFAAIRSSSIE